MSFWIKSHELTLNLEAMSSRLQSINITTSRPSYYPKNILERPQLECQALERKVSRVLLEAQVRGEALEVLLIVEHCSEEIYKLKSAISKVPKSARFKKEEERTRLTTTKHTCLPRARERTNKKG